MSQSTRDYEDTPELHVCALQHRDICKFARKLDADTLNTRLSGLLPGEAVSVYTLIGPISGTYVGDEAIVSNYEIDRRLKTATVDGRHHPSIVIDEGYGEAHIVDRNGTVQPTWVIIPKSTIFGIM